MDIWVSERSVLQCRAAVESAIKDLLATADGMKSGLDHLTGVCAGEQFEAIRTEVDREVAALHAQVSELNTRVSSKLGDIIAWVRKAKTSM